MEFRFNIDQFFRRNVARVGNNLVPSDFQGDRRTLLDTTSKFSEIINDMGEASARAQGLTRAVTTAQKLRNSEHTVYLMYEKGGKNGLVTGLLKVGRKLLYVFDEEGETHTVDAPCVLDFYVHETRQRFGLGKELFQFMLDCEKYKANQLAIDRPSDKLLAFLRKHYGLERQIRQMNNFVIYDGFFDLNEDQNNNAMNGNGARLSNLHITNSPNTLLFGPQFLGSSSNRFSMTNEDPVNLSPKNVLLMSPAYESVVQSSPIGRYAAPRPMGHMAEIIHNDSVAAAREHDRYRTLPLSRYQRNPQYFSSNDLTAPQNYAPSMYTDADGEPRVDDLPAPPPTGPKIAEPLPENEPIVETPPPEQAPHVDDLDGPVEEEKTQHFVVGRRPSPPSFLKNLTEELQLDEPIKHLQSPNQSFHYSKQHTGLKNLSFNVGAAVMPSASMEFDQDKPESFGVVKINRPARNIMPTWEPHKIIGRRKVLRLDVPNPEKLMASKSAENLTDQGYLDLKFYHNKLW